MDNAKNTLQGDYEKFFPSRLRKLMDDNHISQQKLADHLGLKNRQSVAGYCSGRSTPDLDSIVKIARFFDVSTDYLLGMTEDPAPRPSVVDDLGLSPKAVQYLRTLQELTKIPPYDDRISLLSHLFESGQFDLMLSLCVRYVNLMSMIPELSFSMSDDYIFCKDTLKAHGFVISLPDEQANALFSERIVNLLRTVLDELAERIEHIKLDYAKSRKNKAAPGAANTESGKDDTDH